jgi:hypothetical protein
VSEVVCGLFAVWRRNGRQRLIVDARRSNQWFTASPHTALATRDSFSRLVAAFAMAVELGQTDIQDAFYQLVSFPTLESRGHGLDACV